jgi:hypothetical protein
MYHLVKNMQRHRSERILQYRATAALSGWAPPIYSIYSDLWQMATAATMNDARVPLFRRTRQTLSPFEDLTPFLRATGPHQGREWWTIENDDRTYDFLALRERIMSKPDNMHAGELIRISPNKYVKWVVYNWDTDLFTPRDVAENIQRMDMNIVDELNPRGGKLQSLTSVSTA